MAVTSPEYVPQAAPVAQPTTETQPPKQWRTAHIVAVAVSALVITVVAAAGITYAVVTPGPKDPESAIPACRERVKAQLKAPTTAKFPGGESVGDNGSQPQIDGIVDSQNGFGAMVRGAYSCVLSHDKDGNVRIASVTVH